MISKFRPQTDIVGATINQKVWRQLSLSWGVKPVLCQLKDNTDELFDHAVDVTVKAGAAKKGRHSCNYGRYSAWVCQVQQIC